MTLTAAYLRERLHYDPVTGVFTWRPKHVRDRYDKIWNTRFAGTRAGSVNAHGHRTVRVDDKAYYEHRLVWLYVHGEWPSGLLDHRNRRGTHNVVGTSSRRTSKRARNVETRDNIFSTKQYKSVKHGQPAKESNVTIRIEITGEDAAEVAQNLVTMAFMLAPNLRGGPAKDAPAAVEAEAVEEPKKPRGRPKKAETIEHEPVKEAKEEITPEAVENEQETVAQTTELPPKEIAPEKAAEAEALTIDDLRKFTVDEYLLKQFKALEDQKSAFKALLDQFGVTKIGDLPTDKIGEFKAVVDAKIAEAAK